MRTVASFLCGAVLVLPLYGQQPAVKRKPGDHVHYNVSLADGDVSKVTRVSMVLATNAPEAPNQLGSQGQFGADCQKTKDDPKVWFCDGLIPPNIRPGDYRVLNVVVATDDFGKGYHEDFHVPLVPIENPNTFTPPTKVTVTPQP